MEAITLRNPEPGHDYKPALAFPQLEEITRPTVPTDQAAYYLNRRPQTLRRWACYENWPAGCNQSVLMAVLHGRWREFVLHWELPNDRQKKSRQAGEQSGNSED